MGIEDDLDGVFQEPVKQAVRAMPARLRLYTLAQVERAFWCKFHASGEHFFPYWDGEEADNESSTRSAWSDMAEKLEARTAATPDERDLLDRTGWQESVRGWTSPGLHQFYTLDEALIACAESEQQQGDG